MGNIMLLDCTLRDGGYINNWHFGRETISAICRKLSAARLDIIEVGFLTGLPHTEDDSLYSDCDEINAVLKKCEGFAGRYAAMIAIGEMEMDPEGLPAVASDGLSVVRLTFHNTTYQIDKAFRYAGCLMGKGYDVCMQPVGTTSYTDKELLELLTLVNELRPYAFYLVDTLGMLEHKELIHFVDLIDHNLGQGIKLGFHSHNNLQMSYANAQSIMEYGGNREFILDCSVYGMGRGAGNLCTELITQHMNREDRGRYELTPILEAIDDHIYPIFTKTGWGYNAHYYISAVHECHPNYSSFLLNKQTLTMNDVDLILKNIPHEDRSVFNKRLIEKSYRDFQNHVIDDSAGRASLKGKIGNRDILLLASGRTINSYKPDIERFIQDNRPVVITINAELDGYASDFVFVSNLKRLFLLDAENLSVPMILTSNLPHVIQNAVYVDYTAICTTGDEPDNAGMMLLRLMKELGAAKVYIAGFDGFDCDLEKNYYNKRLVNSVDPVALKKRNTAIAGQIKEIRNEMGVISLTPSRYFHINETGERKLVIFDLDGTLADTSRGIEECHKYANAAMGRSVEDKDLEGVIGAPLLDTYIGRFGYAGPEARKAVDIYREHYAQCGYVQSTLYAGINNCLEKLKKGGYTLAVATLKSKQLAEKVLKMLGIDQYFDSIQGMDARDSLSKTDILRMCMSDAGVQRDQVVLVGDSMYDADAASYLGLDFLGVTYGFGFTKATAADFPLADNSEEIKDYIIGRNRTMNMNMAQNPTRGGISVT